MDYYLDIEVVPDEEVPIYFIRNKVYSKLHKALFTLKATDIGVSFPLYNVKLGSIIRIHGNKTKLTELQAENWLGGMVGYCNVSPIKAIPSEVAYQTISRKQANMTEAKLRRLIKRGSIPEEKIKQYKAKMFQQGLDNPYFELESTSNNHLYRRYIEIGKLQSQPTAGQFDYFGLSNQATIPWFE